MSVLNRMGKKMLGIRRNEINGNFLNINIKKILYVYTSTAQSSYGKFPFGILYEKLTVNGNLNTSHKTSCRKFISSIHIE